MRGNMKKAYNKDIWRSMKKGKRRFFSIMLITALGVTMLTGIKAACVNLRYSADDFFDRQNLFDISVVSTLGLTEDDVQALKELESINMAEGAFNKTVYTPNGDKKQSVEMKTFSETGINVPYLIEGNLPQKADEIAVTEKYRKETGKSIGDTLIIEDKAEGTEDGTGVGGDKKEDAKEDNLDLKDEKPTFIHTSYKITGIVTDVMDVNSNDGAVSFRSTATTDYTFFVLQEAVNSNIYTEVYLTLADSSKLLCYSKDYENYVTQVLNTIESQLKGKREQARYDELTSEAYRKLSDSEQEMKEAFAKAEQEISYVEAEFGAEAVSESKKEFEAKRAQAEVKLGEARKEIEEIEMPQWYVQDRTSLSGYGNIKNDAASIETIGTIFPILFFVVAILISLTTITRMVEEDRGLIGTYKALGFKNREIRRKYLLYSFIACLFGGILGDLCGYIVLPQIIFIIFKTMYLLPEYLLKFDLIYGIGGVLLFIIGIVGATTLSCHAELKQMPAVLMRPRSPLAGSRVALEYVTPIWRRLSFLNKVTARNLFRYKKRMIMTVSGIMGCTALVLCGFAIKDSVTELMPKQYENTYLYDLMVIASSKDNEKLLSYIREDENVSEFINVQIDSVKIKNRDGNEEKVQLIVVPDGKTLESFIQLENIEDKAVKLDESGIIVTQNAGIVLDFKKGDMVSLQNLKLVQAKVEVSELVKNYLGNNVYMTQKVYENLFGIYEPNGVLANLTDTNKNHSDYAEELAGKDGVISAISTENLKEEFASAFSLINMVVYILIIMAAGLAFAVLFTLSTTNISERERELATIKVLGFYDKEVHLYVNKETFILTGIGILLGLPLGYIIGNCLTYALKMPSIYFAVSIHPISYVISAVMSYIFALLVNLITDRSLDVIDPIEALKSIE
ncbi:FtsX-like permease family protein [Lachnoclostridium sp.]|uniref:FtsX-like permease family protein n=1 Tax=Lachnoclostridium sp. TaxID=2028282 RepID=UPI00289C2E5B|nr:FtsX-like permease family protein [Lachnoclostridium sp.]